MTIETDKGWTKVDSRHYTHTSGAVVYKSPTKAFEYAEWGYRMPEWKLGGRGIGGRAAAMRAVARELSVIAKRQAET